MTKNRKNTLVLVLSILVCMISFLIINLLNFDVPENGNRSGNGNLAVAGYPFAIASAISILIFGSLLCIKLLRRLSRVWSIVSLLIFITIQVLLYEGFENHFYKKIDYLGGGPKELSSFIIDMGWVNTYTNDMYFNVYSFFTVLVLPIIISSLIRLIKKA
ncbi:hypothetical protein [Terribacillus sp. JSM ZJ617]|uniref:hypothetical protein n=1 Tax=Terribacillus sp. JSM ZJ617 TaxID=3342119 RepID=UPI0035A8EAEF